MVGTPLIGWVLPEPRALRGDRRSGAEAHGSAARLERGPGAASAPGGTIPAGGPRDHLDPAAAIRWADRPAAAGILGRVNLLDAGLIVLLVVGTLVGYRRGLILQVASYGGLLLGLLLGVAAAPLVAGLADSGAPSVAAATVTLLLCAAIGNGLGWIVGSIARARARATVLGGADRAGGAVISVLALAIAVWFVALNVVGGPWPSVSREVRASTIVRALDDALPEPPSLVAQVRRFLDRYGFPDVFTGIPPVPADPVRMPTEDEVRAAYRSGAPSTFRVVGPACDRIQEGSGFVVAPSYLLTNAHVVAGVRRVVIQRAGEPDRPAVVVRFDPQIDLALLRVEDLPAPLRIADTEADRGATGVVIGYPDGGPLTASVAAVGRWIDAMGRDIYGRGEVERAVYELQTVVHPGNSGGPFVLADGRVAGVLFAASRTDGGIAYAIAASEVLPWLDVALGRTEPVSTGPCTRD